MGGVRGAESGETLGLRDLPRLARRQGEAEALEDRAAGNVAGEHDEWDAATWL